MAQVRFIVLPLSTYKSGPPKIDADGTVCGRKEIMEIISHCTFVRSFIPNLYRQGHCMLVNYRHSAIPIVKYFHVSLKLEATKQQQITRHYIVSGKRQKEICL